MKSRYETVQPLIMRRAARRLELYTKLLNKGPTHILEIGCGPGWMVQAFTKLGVKATGIEINEELVRTASALGADVKQADICHVSPTDFPACDVVCASQTLEHIFTPRLALWKMSSLLQPGGIIHIDVPNADSWGARVRRVYHGRYRWGVISLPHHQIGYYPDSLRKLFSDTGLETLKILERPTDDEVFGQVILPKRFVSRVAMKLSGCLGHGYLLVGLASKPAR